MESQKNVFWQAFLTTVLIFSLGIIAGVVLENWRTDKVDSLYKQSEIDLLDIRLQSDIISDPKLNCKKAIEENIKFADRVYEEAKILEKYETASQITEDLKLSHKKYDLLRTMLLLNSIEIKDKCNASYYEVVYFYKFNNPTIEIKAKESVFSNILKELKDKLGNKILLIPIAADNELSSVDLVLDKYNISKDKLPIILINGKVRIDNLENVNDLLKYFKCQNSTCL